MANTQNIPNYLVQAILVTLCCCQPFGIVAIVFAAQVDSKANAGDLAGAQDMSDKARMFSTIGFIIGLLVNGLVFIVQIMAIASSS